MMVQGRDENGNVIYYRGPLKHSVHVQFLGKNNILLIHGEAKTLSGNIKFYGDNGHFSLGAMSSFRGSVIVGNKCKVSIGNKTTVTSNCFINTAEETDVIIGDDCMIASDTILRTHDSHPIFDVLTQTRMNTAQSIVIGDHVWLGDQVIVLGGARVAEGSIVGIRGLVTGSIPNNSIAVGSPARVIKTDIAWERPNLNKTKMNVINNANEIECSVYWNKTKK
ncbi:acyltransferase [Citrobacter freundii]|uniref:acyltransferase n=1 Tax=Citrobacter freundii TaxID=546 RepID=UPI00292BA3DA|nr:acyltransferase [Citrobacter freundii]MDV1747572.1 acyltransferase [Citrobacter freundii]MEB0445351.1 acyltransferase [Citrobacter freundii]